MLQTADKEMMDAYNAQSEGVVRKGVQVAFFDGSEPDKLSTEGCKRDCTDQHPHLETCVIDGCPPNCALKHGHGADCVPDCQDRHHTYICQNRHHIKAAGTPKFRNVVYLKKVIPGDILNVIVRPKRPEDEQEFAEAWRRYVTKSETPAGIPLETVPWLTPAQRAEFNAAHCFTAEDVANMNDAVAQKFMGIHGIRRRMQDFIDATSGQSEKKIAYLEKKLEELAAKVATKAK